MNIKVNTRPGLVGRVFSIGPRDRNFNPGRIILKHSKMVFYAALHKTQHYKVRLKWTNPGKGEAFLLHLGVIALEKGAFGKSSTTVTNFTYYMQMKKINLNRLGLFYGFWLRNHVRFTFKFFVLFFFFFFRVFFYSVQPNSSNRYRIVSQLFKISGL